MKTKLIADLTSNHLGNLAVLESMIQALAEQKDDQKRIRDLYVGKWGDNR